MDIDIDFQTSFDPRRIIKQAIPASQVKDGRLVKHPCGHYIQTIPVDQHTGLAAIPYEQAEEMGFFKIDFLHLTTLNLMHSKEEVRQLSKKEPNWELLQDPQVVARLSQVKNSGDMLKQLKPQSVQELADAIALIRPGKRYLLNKYLRDKDGTRDELYRPREGVYCYKRPHAIAYALTIVLELHLIAQGRL